MDSGFTINSQKEPLFRPSSPQRENSELSQASQKAQQTAQALLSPIPLSQEVKPLLPLQLKRFLSCRQEVGTFLHHYFVGQQLNSKMAHFFHFSLEEFALFAYYCAFEAAQEGLEERHFLFAAKEAIEQLNAELPFSDRQVRQQLNEAIRQVLQQNLKGATEQNDQERCQKLEQAKKFLENLCGMLDIAFSAQIPLKRPEEKEAILPYLLFKKMSIKRDNNLHALNNIFQSLSQALNDSFTLPKELFKSFKELIDRYNIDQQRYLKRYQLYQKQASFTLEELAQKTPLEKRKIICQTKLLLVEPLEEYFLELVQLFESMQKQMQHDPLAKNLTIAIYKNFLSACLRQEYPFEKELLEREEKIGPLFKIMRIVALRIDPNAKKQGLASLERDLSPSWQKWLDHFYRHVKMVESEFCQREEKSSVVSRIYTILNSVYRKRNRFLADLGLLAQVKTPFAKLLSCQVFKVIAKAQTQLQSEYEQQSDASDQCAILHTNYRLASTQSKVFRAILQGFERAIALEIDGEKRQKAKAFYALEEDDFKERHVYLKKKRAPSKTSSKDLEVFSGGKEESERVENLSETLWKNLSASLLESPVLSLPDEPSFYSLSRALYSRKVTALTSMDKIFQADASYHFSFFMRGWELLQLNEQLSEQRQEGILPLLIYHLGLANEQILSSLYLKTGAKLTHRLVKMANQCGLPAHLVAPLEQASIAFRYPHQHHIHLKSLPQIVPDGLKVILDETRYSSGNLEPLFQEGISHLATCFSLEKKGFEATWQALQKDFKALLPKMELDSALIEGRLGHFKKMAALKQKLLQLCTESDIEGQEENVQAPLKDARAHLVGYGQLLAWVQQYPYQRFLAFFEAALNLRAQYALENMAQVIAIAHGQSWRSHSLKAYSQAYQIKEALSKESAHTWDFYDMEKATDYPFWHFLSQKKKLPLLNELHHHLPLSQGAVEAGEGFIPPDSSIESFEKAYGALAERCRKTVRLLEEMVKKVLNPSLPPPSRLN